MQPTGPVPHLSQITTLWTMVNEARSPDAAAANEARQQLLRRYGGAVKRYLLGALRDAEAADDLTQEFALRFLSGKCGGAEPERGRFRNFVKGVLAHLITDYFRRQQARNRPLRLDDDVSASCMDPAGSDPLFVESWRQELLARAWQALAQVEADTGQPFHTVLRLRVDQPALRSPELAEQLASRLGKPVSAAGVRQTLHRARDRFADLLVEEVVQTLGKSAQEDLEQELIELNLLTYCQPALDRRHGKAAAPEPD